MNRRSSARELAAAALPLLLTVISGGCASDTTLASSLRASISARHQGQVVELRQSCYWGDLYEENQKLLLSPYPFADTHHIVDLDRRPIRPQKQRGLVPAGTRLVIQRIEFPDPPALMRRMLTTPRYNTWVYLAAAPLETRAPGGSESIGSAPSMASMPLVLLLPMDLKSEARVEEELDKLLLPEGEVSAWLATRRPTVRVAIENKDVQKGMSQDEVTAALGSPQRWFVEQKWGLRAVIAWYPSREVWLVNDSVIDVVIPGRPVDTAEVGSEPAQNAKPDATPGAKPGSHTREPTSPRRST